MTYFFSIFFGTFILEDLSLAAALGLVADSKISFTHAFMACFFGIFLGDILLYYFGYFIALINTKIRVKHLERFSLKIQNTKRNSLLTYSIIASRFIPGTRFFIFLSSGFFRYPILKFIILNLLTVFAWVLFAFVIGFSFKDFLMNHLILGIFSILMFFHFLKTCIPIMTNSWSRKAFLHAWRKYLNFEFWPAPIFYIPLIPYIIYLVIKYRSLTAAFYANPDIENGGFIGESKWDFLKHLDSNYATTLKSIKMTNPVDFKNVKDELIQNQLDYPIILKPDIGQRGFAVRIIRDDYDLTEYLLLSNFDIIIQEFSAFENEAGIFFIKDPNTNKAHIFSITDKKLPIIFGDGKTKLGDLILKDKRARIIASTYFSRLQDQLDTTPAEKEMIQISECGNHCQGAIFLNGDHLKTPELKKAIQQISDKIPNFYFGRLDIKYKTQKDLMLGNNFQIVEINGAGSEATHIWDPNTRLLDAYKSLFEQWNLLFKIGKSVQAIKTQKANISIKNLITNCTQVYFRKSPLSTSS